MWSQRSYMCDPWTWTKVGDCWREDEYWVEGDKGEYWDNCNSIINKICLKNVYVSNFSILNSLFLVSHHCWEFLYYILLTLYHVSQCIFWSWLYIRSSNASDICSHPIAIWAYTVSFCFSLFTSAFTSKSLFQYYSFLISYHIHVNKLNHVFLAPFTFWSFTMLSCTYYILYVTVFLVWTIIVWSCTENAIFCILDHALTNPCCVSDHALRCSSLLLLLFVPMPSTRSWLRDHFAEFSEGAL